MLRPPTMKRWGGGVMVAAMAAMSGCASTPPVAEKTIEPTATEDSAFVLSRNPAAAKPAERVPVHVGDQWWAFRADFLKVNEDKARDRDGDISEKQAPAGFWDLQTSVETISIWTTFCNECHGGRRKMEDVIRMPDADRGLGKRRRVVLRDPAPVLGDLSNHLQRQDRERGQPLEDAGVARKALQGTDLGVDLLRRVSVWWH